MSITLKKGNRGTFVLWLQYALNSACGLSLDLDGDFGTNVETAVRDLQVLLDLEVDGIAGRKTQKAIGLDLSHFYVNGTETEVCWLLPKNGKGYKTYNRDGNDQFGTLDTVCRMMEYAAEFFDKTGVYVEIGNMSRYHGGRHRPHRSHKNGQQTDTRLVRNDGRTGHGFEYWDSMYSRELTQKFINTVRSDSKNLLIYFNDPKVKGVRKMRGHDNHLHFSFTNVRAKYNKLPDFYVAASVREIPLQKVQLNIAEEEKESTLPSASVSNHQGDELEENPAASPPSPELQNQNAETSAQAHTEPDADGEDINVAKTEMSVFETFNKYGDKVRETVQKQETTIDTLSKVSKGSLFMQVWKQIVAVGFLLVGWFEDNWHWIVLGVVVFAIAAWLWSRSKDRQTERNVALINK